jgi:lipoprotein signal peptidase
VTALVSPVVIPAAHSRAAAFELTGVARLRAATLPMALVAAVAAADSAVKTQALGLFPPASTSAATDGLRLAQVENPGFMLGFAESGSFVVLLTLFISIAFLLGLVLDAGHAGASERVAVGLFAGGLLGNSLDRLGDGRVIDYIDLVLGGRSVLTVNLSDVSMAAAILLLVGTLVSLRFTERGLPGT